MRKGGLVSVITTGKIVEKKGKGNHTILIIILVYLNMVKWD